MSPPRNRNSAVLTLSPRQWLSYDALIKSMQVQYGELGKYGTFDRIIRSDVNRLAQRLTERARGRA